MTTEYHRFDAIAKSSVTYDILFCYVAAYLYADRETYIIEGSGNDTASDAYCNVLVELVTYRTKDSWNRIRYIGRSLGVEAFVFLRIRISTKKKYR